MYHLTCPSCQDVTESHFVRSGAVVRCDACDQKYRIKSGHFERVIHSGPRTLDETDSVLRSDSVDIDPEEIAPVSIDDDGNVVGLSGLSELMRFSDDQAQTDVDHVIQKDKAKRKSKKQANDEPLPQAKAVSPKRSKKTTKEPTPTTARERAQALKRKKQHKLYIMLGSSALILLVFIAILIPMMLPDDADNDNDNGDDPDGDTFVGTEPSPPDQTPSPDTDTGKDIAPKPDNDDLLFTNADKPSPNPATKFVPPWSPSATSPLSQDVPTVLTPAKHLTHEGWYVMTPPRGSADATGDTNVKLNQLTAAKLNDTTTRLTGSINNNTNQLVMAGEAHLMLLDSTANVFAETYTPLGMIPPGDQQQITLDIPTRYWNRSRGVRAGVQIAEWRDQYTPIDNLEINPVGQGPTAALRVSTKNNTDKPLRAVSITLHAKDEDGNTLASFLIQENNLYIPQNHWLDLVIATPLPEDTAASDWSCSVISR